MNKHGLDAPYFKKNLEKIILEIDNYTPEEMRLALTRLSSVAVSGVRVVDRGWTTSGCDDQTELNKIEMIIIHSMKDSLFYIAHRKSRRHAFKPEDNGFKTRKAAVDFAEAHGCEVVEFKEDDLHLKFDV